MLKQLFICFASSLRSCYGIFEMQILACHSFMAEAESKGISGALLGNREAESHLDINNNPETPAVQGFGIIYTSI
jgi:hypothetical protein